MNEDIPEDEEGIIRREGELEHGGAREIGGREFGLGSSYNEKRDKEKDSGSLGSPPISPNPESIHSAHSPNLSTTFADFPPRGPSRASYGGSLFGKWRVSKAPTFIPRERAIRQEDLVNSAERVFARYLVQGAEKEIYLP